MGKKIIIANTRRADQKVVYQQILNDGVCPFCPEHLLTYHHNPLLIESEHWIVTKNQWPYDYTQLQLLIIAKRHIESIKELTADEWVDWAKVLSQAIKSNNLSFGAVCMRFNDPTASGASVAHLHAHIIVPDPEAVEPVRFKIGSNK